MAYRNDIITCGTYASPIFYYLFPGENFNTKHGLNPGDVVGIKQGAGGQNFVQYIDLGAGSVNGITFIPDPTNPIQIEIGWFRCGAKGRDVNVRGKTSS